MTPYERVKLSRERTAATFPLPSPVDCIRYAITELAEYDDALLRQERTGDKRNNDKAHSAERELGQALYMLLSAAVQLDFAPHSGGRFGFPERDWRQNYCAAVRVLAWLAEDLPQTRLINDTYAQLRKLAAHHGWDVAELVDGACAKFEAKHAPEVQP